MKNTKNKIVVAALVLMSLTAFAAQKDGSGIEKWVGTGVKYNPAGQQISTYSEEVTVTPSDATPGAFQSVAKITKEDGSVLTITQNITSSGMSFQISSNLGNGGGSCYGDDFCEAYIAGENGLAYATTVVRDGKNLRRDLTFELQNGKAVATLKDTMKRVN